MYRVGAVPTSLQPVDAAALSRRGDVNGLVGYAVAEERPSVRRHTVPVLAWLRGGSVALS